MRFLRFGLPPLLLAATLFALSSRSRLPSPDVVGFDKLAHLVAFGALSWLIARALFAYGLPRTAALWGAIALTVAYGTTDELHQYFVPGRSPDLLDLLADLLGAVAAAVAWWRWSRPPTGQPARGA